MCIVIDAPLLVSLFKTSDPNHEKYMPVLNWLVEGSGKLVFGGTTYLNELNAVSSILGVLKELEKVRKVVRISDQLVDAHRDEVKKIAPEKNFDDPHLVAIVRASNCRLICVNDPRSHKYLRAVHLYESSKQRPSLYTREKNKHLLCDGNIAKCCK